MAGATSGPASPTCSPRSRTTSSVPAGGPASRGGSRYRCRQSSPAQRGATPETVAEWMRHGCARQTRPLPRPDIQAAVLLPDGTRRSLSGLRQFRRHPPLQSVRLLRAHRRPAGRFGRDHLRGFPSRPAGDAVGCSGLLPPPPPANPHYLLGDAVPGDGTLVLIPARKLRSGETGIATVYPAERSPHFTTDGEVFDQAAMAAAHQTSQLPAIARSPTWRTGRQVLVRINDRGPATPHRLIQITRRTATLLGFPPTAVSACSCRCCRRKVRRRSKLCRVHRN